MSTITQRSFADVVGPDALRAYVQKVYSWMVGGLMLTALVAMGVASSPSILSVIFGNTIIMWTVMLAPLGIVFFLSARLDKIKPSTAGALFVVFSILIGLSLSSIFIIYTAASISTTFFVAAGMYAAAALYGYTTKRDLTNMGSFLFMGLIGLILASIVNWFLGSSALDFAISIIGVLIFTGLTAWDMQKLKSQSVVMYAGEAAAAKMSIMGALSLYLNFINLFLFLLRLLGDRR